MKVYFGYCEKLNLIIWKTVQGRKLYYTTPHQLPQINICGDAGIMFIYTVCFLRVVMGQVRRWAPLNLFKYPIGIRHLPFHGGYPLCQVCLYVERCSLCIFYHLHDLYTTLTWKYIFIYNNEIWEHNEHYMHAWQHSRDQSEGNNKTSLS